ncbi:MAG: hypothetical protein QF911_02725 [Candidatus Thalassarchaeaceae archaeon]|nr:hypothetical protein [Candidatus Thalassarchaeaceae archaeon]
MGVGRALVFSVFAMIPGALLSLLGWVLIGSPGHWNTSLYLACYAPFLGCVVAGFYIGLRTNFDSVVEV